MKEKNNSLVYSVEEAGAKLGLSRASAYKAARSGDIPTIRIGRLLKVPKGVFDKLIGVQQQSAVEALHQHKEAIKPEQAPADGEKPPDEAMNARLGESFNAERKVGGRTTVPINLRVKPELREHLEAAAAEIGRSLTDEIRGRLYGSFAPAQDTSAPNDEVMIIMGQLLSELRGLRQDFNEFNKAGSQSAKNRGVMERGAINIPQIDGPFIQWKPDGPLFNTLAELEDSLALKDDDEVFRQRVFKVIAEHNARHA